MKSAKILLATSLILFMVTPIQAHAGIIGKKCYDQRDYKIINKAYYYCNFGGDQDGMYWQRDYTWKPTKKPTKKSKKKTINTKTLAKYNDCIRTYGTPMGDPSMDEARLMMARGLCAKFKP